MQQITKRTILNAAASGKATEQMLQYLNELGGNSRILAAATPIGKFKFVGLNTSGLLAVASSTTRAMGVTDEDVKASGWGNIRFAGRARVYGAADLTIMDELVSTPDGFAAPFQSASIGLASALIATDAQDDLTQGNLPDTVQAVCAGDETGNTMIIYGDVGGVLTKETVTLGTAATYTSTNTFTAVYGIQITAAAVGQITVEDGTSTANIIPTAIAALAAARFYGQAIPDDSTNPKGHAVSIHAGGANTAVVVLKGTDYNGDEIWDRVTMTGTTLVNGVKGFRSLDGILIGADGIAFGAGVTSQYTAFVPGDERSEVLALALETTTLDGKDTEVFLLTQNTGLVPSSIDQPGEMRVQCNASTSVLANRFMNLSATMLAEQAPTAAGRVFGVALDTMAINQWGRAKVGPKVQVLHSADIAAGDELVAVPGGFAAPIHTTAISMSTATINTDTDDDLVHTNLPDTVQAICAGDETGNTLEIFGDVAGVLTKEVLTLGTAATYTTINTWAEIYCIRMTAAATGTIDVEDGTGTAAIIATQIAALDPARFYGGIVPDVSTDPDGHKVRINAGGANATDCVIWGTDYAGAEQYERITLNGTTEVNSTLAYRSVDQIMTGADLIAFNAGVTSQYDLEVEADAAEAAIAVALETNTVDGSLTDCIMLDGAVGKTLSGDTQIFYNALEAAWGGGGVSTTYTVKGIAATDIIQATMAACANAVSIQHAVRSAADTVTVTFTADPGAGTIVGLTVIRP